MQIVNFMFDQERDLKNIWGAANKKSSLFDFSKSLRPDLLNAAKSKDFSEASSRLIQINQNIYSSDTLTNFPELLNNSWSEIEEYYVLRLKNITGKGFFDKNIRGYVTTIAKCPYNPFDGWFMVCLFNSVPGCMLTTGHELFHIHFHRHFFEDIARRVGEEKAHDIKEAVTSAILNLEFKDLWGVEDQGYDKHHELRKFIEIEWKKDKDFNLLLDKCVQKIRK